MNGSSDNAAAGPSKRPAERSTSINEHDESDEDERGDDKRPRRNSETEGTTRVQLACLYCRSKRIRCSGTRPICEACIKAKEVCEWPSGRRRKRTRKEMEEARRQEAEQAKVEVPPVEEPTSDPFQGTFDFHSDPFSAAGFSGFVWPTGFTPENQPTMPLLPPIDSHVDPNMISMDPSGNFPDLRLISALERQTAVIEGDLGGDDLELFYYRMSGPTALTPGVNRISLKLQRRSTAESPYNSAPQPESGGSSHSIELTTHPINLWDDSGLPHPHVYEPLMEMFYQYCSQHFPSVSRQRMNERFASGTMSAFLANCLCALGARFSEGAQANPMKTCAPFIAKAQELIIPLLHLPTSDVCSGLLFLAWACYGQNSESGLWQYLGMSIRMAIDLGFHENIQTYESPQHKTRSKLLLWNLFIADRIVAFGTGRPASIPEDIIEIALPEDQDFFPDPARNTPMHPNESIEPVPFVQFTKLMVICGRISNVLNGRRGRVRTLVSSKEPLAEQLAELQMRLIQFVSGLPMSLQWSPENFKRQQDRGHGGVFLSLHLWANSVLALVYHPELLKSPSGIETPLNQSMSRSMKLALASSRQISECMVFADLVTQSAYTSSPWLVQPLYVAAMALIHEMRPGQTAGADGEGRSFDNPTSVFFMTMSRQNVSALVKALQRLEHYWAGVGAVTTMIEKRSGMMRSSSSMPRPTFISLPDHGLLRRFTTDRKHPHHIAPPTETSMREAEEMSASENDPSPYWLADLMSGYTVENMSFGPADSTDLERLLASTPGQSSNRQSMSVGNMGGPSDPSPKIS